MVFCVPAGWPPAVRRPGNDGFEASAVEFSWMSCRRDTDTKSKTGAPIPIGLAQMACHHAEACLAGARQGYRSIRAELGTSLPPGEIDAVLVAYGAKGVKLAATARAVELVEQALRQQGFRPVR